MEFSLICPRDGRVVLGLEDISAVVFHDMSSCDIVFICPHCGSALRIAVQVPHLLRVALELAHMREAGAVGEAALRSETEAVAADDDGALDEPGGRELAQTIDAYCEYFRRQLARVTCVEDFLQESDAGQYQP